MLTYGIPPEFRSGVNILVLQYVLSCEFLGRGALIGVIRSILLSVLPLYFQFIEVSTNGSCKYFPRFRGFSLKKNLNASTPYFLETF